MPAVPAQEVFNAEPLQGNCLVREVDSVQHNDHFNRRIHAAAHRSVGAAKGKNPARLSAIQKGEVGGLKTGDRLDVPGGDQCIEIDAGGHAGGRGR